MNVLIATPTYAGLLRPETVRAVGAQRVRGQYEWVVVEHNPWPAPDVRNVVAAYQHIRERFLAGSWDALLTVEHDMIPPEDALHQLWEMGQPVAYGVYLLRHGTKVLNVWEYIGDKNLGESLSLHPQRLRAAVDKGTARVSGVGFGCTLMRREVVERFPFHDGAATGTTAPDIPFAQDCLRAGVEAWAHFGVLCGHVEDGWVIWPFDETMGETVKVKAQQAVVVNLAGQSVRLQPGQEYEMPLEQAHDLGRAGYARVIVNGTVGSGDALLQAPADAPTKRRKPARAKRQ